MSRPAHPAMMSSLPIKRLFEERGLDQPSLAQPEVAVGGEQPVAEQEAQALVADAFDVVALVLLENVPDVARLDQQKERRVAHAKAHDVRRFEGGIEEQAAADPGDNSRGCRAETYRADRGVSLGPRGHASAL